MLKIDSVIRLFFHKQGVVIVNDDLVIAFSGLDVTNFVISSGSGAIVIVVFIILLVNLIINVT